MRKIREPYHVSEDYFEDLERVVLSKTVHKKPMVPLRWLLATAASVVLVCGFWFFGLRDEAEPISQNVHAGANDHRTELADIRPLISSVDLTYVLAEEKGGEGIQIEGAMMKEHMNIDDQEIEGLMVEAGLVSLELDEDLLGDLEI